MFSNIRNKVSILACVSLMAFAANGQSPLMKMADHYFDNMSYTKAIDAFEQVLKKKGLSNIDQNNIKLKLAESYLKIKDSQNAERMLAEVVQSTSEFNSENASTILKYAQALASNSKYQESQEQYQKYNSIVDSDPRGAGFSKLYNDVSVLTKNAACYKTEYLSINTNASDFSPSYYQNGLIFVSNRKTTNGVRRVFSWNDTPFLDLYYLDDIASLTTGEAGLGSGQASTSSAGKSKRGFLGNDEYTANTANDSRTIGNYGYGNNTFSAGYADKPLTESDRMKGSINSKYHEGPATFFKDGSTVIFTRNNVTSGGSTTKSSDGVVKLKLYMAHAKKDSWGDITPLPFNSDEYSTGHPALSPDEKLLYFVSDMPGGYGGTDIYVSKFDGSNWSAPENMGDKINTKGNEMFPFVDEKGNLYFSSEGLPGLGQLDIFYTQLEGTKQKGSVSNLGSPINSSSDDFGIATDGLRKVGYFSSNRKRGGADDDIYKFERECELAPEGCDLLIAVYDAETKMPLSNSTVSFTNKDGKPELYMTNESGFVQVTGIAEDFNYSINTSREGYLTSKVKYSTDECDNETSRLEIALAKPVKTETDETITKIEDAASTDPTPINAKSCIIKGKVISQATNAPIAGASVTCKNGCTGKSVTVISKADGSYSFVGTEGCDFTLEAKKEGLASKVSSIKKLTCKLKPNGVESNVYMFTKGDAVQIENIYFDYTKYNLRPDAIVEMDKIVKIMREYPKMRIELGSHTDSRSSTEFNQDLSNKRARSTAEYLFKRGISRARVEYKGYGETKLVNQCADGVKCSEDEHALNRRSEFTILQMN